MNSLKFTVIGFRCLLVFVCSRLCLTYWKKKPRIEDKNSMFETKNWNVKIGIRISIFIFCENLKLISNFFRGILVPRGRAPFGQHQESRHDSGVRPLGTRMHRDWKLKFDVEFSIFGVFFGNWSCIFVFNFLEKRLALEYTHLNQWNKLQPTSFLIETVWLRTLQAQVIK